MTAAAKIVLLFMTTVAGAAELVLPPADEQASWTAEQKLIGFRNMSRIYGGDVVHHGTSVLPLPRNARQLEVRYQDASGHPVDAGKFMRDNRVAGLIVLSHGRVMLERYALGQTRHDQWVSFSVAKSVTSTLLGAAIRDGAISSLDDPVSRYIPELSESYKGVSLRQALTMSVGLRWNENYTDPGSDWMKTLSLATPGDARPGVDIVAYMAQLPRASAPGTAFLYNSGNAQILGIVVQRAVHETLAAYLEQKIWRTVGMEADAYWVRDRFGRTFGRSLLNATLRDYARFGYFFMHGAEIAGVSILPAGWLEDATRSHIATDWGEVGYGYQWWINADGSYRAIGIYGQMIYLDPRSDLVIVTNSAWPQADWDPGFEAYAAFTLAVTRALRSAGS